MKYLIISFLSLISLNLNAAENGFIPSRTIGFIAQLLPFILIGVVFYFFIIRPQTQRRNALAKMIETLHVGDKVITTAGIIGTIWRIEDNSFILELFDGNKIEILKGAITSIINDQQNK
ncbi:MAG: preprotein translocase subunit YajC [bacterium]